MKVIAIALAAVLLLGAVAAPARAERVDLELALAVDASASVDEGEFRLQLQGIAGALRDEAVIEAIRSGPTGRIAANLVVWAEARVPKDETGWFVLAGRADAERFARAVALFPRRLTGGTAIGDGIAAAIRSMRGNGIEAPRQVVDVSGDGKETTPREFVVMMPQARAMAVAQGVTLNGLAIRNEVEDLDLWYRRHVQVGTDSFVLSVTDYADFAEAMRRKLLREIEYRPRIGMR